MSETLLLTEADIETTTLTQEASDETLIDTAKALNESIRGHLRRSVEDFWKLGETLSYLYRRRHLKGRWADILNEIGISTTTDNHARRLYNSTTLDGLGEYRNKTAALRALGILSTPEPKSLPGIPTEVEVRERETTAAPEKSKVTLPMAIQGRSDQALVEEVEQQEEDGEDDDRTTPIADHRKKSSPASDNSLELLAKIAARLELLVAQEITVTTDQLAQIDRAMAALDRLREKGVADAA